MTDVTVSLSNSPVVGALQALIAFSGSRGTFTVRDDLEGWFLKRKPGT